MKSKPDSNEEDDPRRSRRCSLPVTRRWSLVTLIAACLCALAQNTEKPELTTSDTETFTLRAQRNLVLVRVVFRDSQGRPVSGFHQQDFRLFDDKKPQVISHFSVEPAASVTSGKAKPVQPGASIEQTREATSGVMPQRYMALFFDDVHLKFEDLNYVRDAADRYLASAVQPEDRVGIFTASGQNGLDFTDDRRKLHEALAQLRPRSRTNGENCPDLTPYHAYLIVEQHDQTALDIATGLVIGCLCGGNPGHCPGDPQGYASMQAEYILSVNETESEYTLTALERLVRRMATIPGQRTIALVSSGFLNRTRRYHLDQIVDQALRLNVAVNALDAKGLYAILPLGDASQHTVLPLDPKAGGIRPELIGALSTINTTGYQVDAEFMEEVAADTGGVFVHDTNDYDGGFRRIGAFPEVYYVLGFTPQNLKLDGRFHSLKVTLADGAHLMVQARRGYFAPKEAVEASAKEQNEIEDAAFSRTEWHEFPLQVQTQFFKVSTLQAKLSVVAHVGLRSLRFRKEQGRNLNTLTLLAALFDHNGNVVDSKAKKLELRLRDASLERLIREGVSLKTSFDVKPGTYLMRVVMREAEYSQMSALNRAVEIPF